MKLERRLRANANIPEDESLPGCWLWTGSTHNDGQCRARQYPQLNLTEWPEGATKRKRRRLLAHRVAYEVWIGPIPKGYRVIQTCGNRLCIRPDHLRAVTYEQSIAWTRMAYGFHRTRQHRYRSKQRPYWIAMNATRTAQAVAVLRRIRCSMDGR